LLASIDGTRGALILDDGVAIDRAITATAAARKIIGAVAGVVVIDESSVGCAVDPLKITLWLPRTGVTGIELADALWRLGHGVENADNDTIAMTVSLVDEPSFVSEMAQKVVSLIERLRREPRSAMPSAVWGVRPEVKMTPRAAVFADRRRVSLKDAAGHISAEQFCPYPPGVPLLGPGELVTQELIEAIQLAGTLGRVAYCSDQTLQTIEVVSQ
jgi:lysine decarboxylase